MHVIKSIHSGHASPRSFLQANHPASLRIAIHAQDGVQLIRWQEIVHCAAESNYTKIFLEDGTSLIVSKTLAKVEAALPSGRFIRVHQSYLVNLTAIRIASTYDVELKGKIKLPVARNRRKALLSRISEIALTV